MGVEARDDAWVLRVWPFGETDAVVSLLTRQHGKIRLVAKGLRRPKGRLGAILSPYHEAEIRFQPMRGERLGRVLEAVPRRVVDPRQLGLEVVCLLAYMAEIVGGVEFEPRTGQRFFRLLSAVARAAAERPPGPEMLLYFQYWAVRLEGQMADLCGCGRCGMSFSASAPPHDIDHEEIRFLCAACRSPHGVSLPSEVGRAWEWVLQIASAPPAEIPQAGDISPLVRTLSRDFNSKLTYITGFSSKSFPMLGHLAHGSA